MISNLILGALLLFSAPSWAQQGSILVERFLGLNDSDPSATIQNEAQDALNVETSPSGAALQKRRGFARSFSLTIATSPISGSYSFIDPNGNRQDIVCHDAFCAKSTNGASFSNFLSSAGVSGARVKRWSFVDLNGSLYGANDKRDPILKYDGTTLSYPAGMPQGAVLELTRDRLVVSDIASTPNDVRYSQSGNFTSFTNGTNAVDPYTDSMGSTGDRVTGLKYSMGRLFIFKSSSINSCIVKDQYTSYCFPVSNSIGTEDHNSIIEIPGAILFKAQDRNYWRLDESGLTLLSQKIGTLVRNQNAGSVQSNTQTSQADWEATVQTPGGTWDSASVAGSMIPSSFTLINQSTAQFYGGTLSSAGFTTSSIQFGAVPSAYSLNYVPTVLPPSATPAWSDDTNGGACTSQAVSASTLTYAVANSLGAALCGSGVCAGAHFQPSFNLTRNNLLLVRAAGELNAVSGAAHAAFGFSNTPTSAGEQTDIAVVRLGTGSVTYFIRGASYDIGEAITPNTFSTYTILITSYSVARFWRNGVFRASGTFSASPVIDGFWMGTERLGVVASGGFKLYVTSYAYASNVADPGSVDIPTISTFTSAIFDATFTTPTAGPFTSTVTTPGASTLTYWVRSSTSSNALDMNNVSYTGVTPPANHLLTNRYWQYKLNLARDDYQYGPSISGVSLAGATTGEFRTQCISAGNPTTAWGLLNCGTTLVGNGSIVFYATSAVTCAALPGTRPSAWTSVTNNTTLTVGVSSAVYIGYRSLLGSSTDQAQVDACTLYWTNGVAAPPAWGTYDSVKNAAFWTTAINNSETNNRVLKYDLNLNQWFPWSLQANAIRSIRSTLYFGDSTGGFWNTFGGVDADSGTAINAYWVSKDFGGGTPFQEKTFQRISLIAKNQVTGNMTVTYTPSDGVANSYTVSLATDSDRTYVRANRSLGLLSPHQFMRVKLGNNSGTYFEVDGMGIDFFAAPWRPVNP